MLIASQHETQHGPRRRWYQRRWVQVLLGTHLALLLLAAYPGYAFYRSWVRPDRPQPTWSGPLTPAQRREIFDALGSEVERFYPYFVHKQVDWPATLERFRPQAEAVGSDREFYLLLAELLATLQDGHTALVSYPGSVPSASPGIRLLYTEGKYAVTAVKEGTGQVRPGDVVLTVDGRKPDEIAALVRQRRGASTEANAEAMTAAALLSASTSSPAQIRLRRPDGQEYELSLPRDTVYWNDRFESRMVDGFAYIRIPSWSPGVDKASVQALESMKDAPGLILDVRGNGGGNDGLAEPLIGRLIDRPTVWTRVRLRFSPFWTPWLNRTHKPDEGWSYRGPVVVLIDGQVFSSNDFFVGGLVRSGRATAIGSPTGGGSGFPALITLPGGAKVRISRWQEAFADGTLVEGQGTRPQIAVVPTVADLAAGRDPALERAVQFLREGR